MSIPTVIAATVILLGSTFMAPTQAANLEASDINGIWLGNLQVRNESLRIQVTVRTDEAGMVYCALESLDQHAMTMGCENVQRAGADFSFDVPTINGHWHGTLSDKTLTGTWSQGADLPLTFHKIAAPERPREVVYDEALAAVDAAGMQAVLDRDLKQSLKDGYLSPQTHAGLTIGVIRHGVRRLFSYGIAKPDSLYEIGSITKTFTGLILSQMILQGKVSLDEPIRKLLPPGTVRRPQGPEIELVDLVTHQSGLPRLPDNFNPRDDANPYIDYTQSDLYAFMAKRGVGKPKNAAFLYSNLGFGLLGQGLANAAGTSYPLLLKVEITEPLGLRDTAIALSEEQRGRFLQGYAAGQPVHSWEFDALAGCGAIRSSAGDMLTYLEIQLHPDMLPAFAQATLNGKTLKKALVQAQTKRSNLGEGTMAFAWMSNSEFGYRHNGGTAGFTSFAFFNPKEDYAAVVLLNLAPNTRGSIADRIGVHINQRFLGKPAIAVE
jgi:D-alanyl-D-alanine-carboxypeptidase/D-alanyl-D-alanine-endopeptidase